MASNSKGYWCATDEVDNTGRIVKLGKVGRYYGQGSTLDECRRNAQECADREAASYLAGQAGHRFPAPMTLRVARVWPVEAADFFRSTVKEPSRKAAIATLGKMLAEGTFTLPERPTNTKGFGQFRIEVLAASAGHSIKEQVDATQPTAKPRRASRARRRVTTADFYFDKGVGLYRVRGGGVVR